MTVRDYECPYGDYEADTRESVAGHLMSVHSINVFHELDKIKREGYVEGALEEIFEGNI